MKSVILQCVFILEDEEKSVDFFSLLLCLDVSSAVSSAVEQEVQYGHPIKCLCTQKRRGRTALSKMRRILQDV